MLRSASSLRRLKYHNHYPKSLPSSLITISHPRYSSSKSSKYSNTDIVEPDLPLKGIRVLELGQLIAGPFAGQLLG
ncbi:hypothetical protein BJ165DRAFT_1467620 [Panaeolus papilionaceus]|nr:hypothetical protein BJ165DRAFT_1467620 [Panaeolus papilionaceus]